MLQCGCVWIGDHHQFRIMLGLSDGSVLIVAVREDQLGSSQSWVAHDCEVWATALDTCTLKLMYSGSDDCRFSCWDLKASP